MRLSEFALASLVWKIVGVVNRSVNTTLWNGNAVPAENVAGRPLVDATHWRGTALPAPATAGVPKVAIEAAGDFAQGAADKVWSTAARALTDKVGFTLTAGSYSIRASSMQRGTTSSATSPGDITISSVTTTRAIETMTGAAQNTSSATTPQMTPTMSLFSSTVLRFIVTTIGNNLVCYGAVSEYF